MDRTVLVLPLVRGKNRRVNFLGRQKGPERGGLTETVCSFAHSLYSCGCAGLFEGSPRPDVTVVLRAHKTARPHATEP